MSQAEHWPDITDASRAAPDFDARPLPGAATSPPPACRVTLPAPCGIPAPCGMPCDLNLGPERHAVVELGNLARLAVMAVPGSRGPFRQQAEELFAQVKCLVRQQPVALTPTTMMVLLRDAADETECRHLCREMFSEAMPVTTIVVQPPCCGAALGIELWAAGGPGVTVRCLGPQLIEIEAEGIRWIYCGGIRGGPAATEPYTEALSVFRRMDWQLARAGARFAQVVRTWLYINQITSGEAGRQRYQELNRARTDFYRHIRFGPNAYPARATRTVFPASTGIGTNGTHITMACMALQSQRPDVFLLPLENSQQTPAFAYQARYSEHSPKFVRAMAVVQGSWVTTLVSGTASIVDSRTVHPGDVARQTEQTIENIERLIAPDNFARHGLPGAGATLRDIAKLRVYVKHAGDYEACRDVCERRLPRVPAIYLQADICRPDLLVEIEAVTFSACDRKLS